MSESEKQSDQVDALDVCERTRRRRSEDRLQCRHERLGELLLVRRVDDRVQVEEGAQHLLQVGIVVLGQRVVPHQNQTRQQLARYQPPIEDQLCKALCCHVSKIEQLGNTKQHFC